MKEKKPPKKVACTYCTLDTVTCNYLFQISYFWHCRKWKKWNLVLTVSTVESTQAKGAAGNREQQGVSAAQLCQQVTRARMVGWEEGRTVTIPHTRLVFQLISIFTGWNQREGPWAPRSGAGRDFPAPLPGQPRPQRPRPDRTAAAPRERRALGRADGCALARGKHRALQVNKVNDTSCWL